MSATGEARPPPPRIGERGTTLLEMLVVVGLLALTAGLVFPALKKPYQRLAADTARSAVLADLRTARAQAIRTAQPVSFAVAPDGRLYGWGTRSRLLPASVRLAEAAPVVFDPDGSSSGGRLAMSDGGRREDLVIDPATGLVGEETPQ